MDRWMDECQDRFPFEGIMGSATEAMAQPSWIEEMGICFLGVRGDSFHLGVCRVERWWSLNCANLW